MTNSLSRARLAELLDRARGKRVVVVGDVMLDVYLIGDVERISPEAPVPVVRVRERKHALGGAANVAQNVAAIGAHAELVGTAGDDRGGEMLRAMLGAIGADTASIDFQPCGGTHVSNTREIGAVVVTKIEKKSANSRRVVLGWAA